MEKLLTTEYLPDTVIPDTAIPDTAIPDAAIPDTDTPKWQFVSTSRVETLSYLKKNPALFQQFRQLKEDWRESFLAFMEDTEHLIADYPWMEEIYEEIAMLRNKPEEVLGMWSEALSILDYNSLKYYVEELQQEIDENTEALAQKDDVLAQKDDKIKELTAMIENLKKQLPET